MINLIRKKGFTLEKSAKTNLAIQTRLSSVGARGGRSWNVCPCSRKRSVSRSWNI